MDDPRELSVLMKIPRGVARRTRFPRQGKRKRVGEEKRGRGGEGGTAIDKFPFIALAPGFLGGVQSPGCRVVSASV